MAYTKVITSGSMVEVYQYEKEPSLTVKRQKHVRPTSESGRPPITIERRIDNVRRVRKGFIRLVRANCSTATPPALLTLTMSSIVSISEANRYFNRFTKLLAKEAKGSFKYIGVPEFQKRGAVHYHVLVWGLSDSIIFNETPYVAWCKKTYKQPKLVRRFLDWCVEKSLDPQDSRGTRFLQATWGYGYVDCVPTDGSPALAGYLAKYMQKSMHDVRLSGKRGYFCSRNVLRPLLFKSTAILSNAKLILGGELTLLTEREFSTQWLGTAKYQLFTIQET